MVLLELRALPGGFQYLKACSLVSKPFRQVSIPVIYRSFLVQCLGDSDDPEDVLSEISSATRIPSPPVDLFVRFLESRPDICQHIRELTLKVVPQFISPLHAYAVCLRSICTIIATWVWMARCRCPFCVTGNYGA